MRQLIEDLISAMEFYVEQTRPIHSTTVALQAARDALKSLSAQQQEPVAWIEHEWSGTGLRHLHFEKREPSVRDEVVNPVWTPLYTSPPASKPLNWEPIQEFWRNNSSIDWDELEAAIEAAHGIKEKNGG